MPDGQLIDGNPKLVIELVGGAVSVTGPIGDRGLCYMMLALARDAVCEHNYRLALARQQEAQQTRAIMDGLRRERN